MSSQRLSMTLNICVYGAEIRSAVEIVSAESELESMSIDDTESIGEWGEWGERGGIIILDLIDARLEEHDVSDHSSGKSESLLLRLALISSFCLSVIVIAVVLRNCRISV